MFGIVSGLAITMLASRVLESSKANRLPWIFFVGAVQLAAVVSMLVLRDRIVQIDRSDRGWFLIAYAAGLAVPSIPFFIKLSRKDG